VSQGSTTLPPESIPATGPKSKQHQIQSQRRQDSIIIASEIQNLEACTGYFKSPDEDVKKIEYSWTESTFTSVNSPEFVEHVRPKTEPKPKPEPEPKPGPEPEPQQEPKPGPKP